MAVKVFITGATGYIGGDALVEIVQAHPDWAVTCLVRDAQKGARLTSAFPHVRIVYGDLDSKNVLEDEAADADLVYHFANNDHQTGALAIASGLARRDPTSRGGAPAYWIHTSGTGILTWKTVREDSWGEDQSKVYDDWAGVEELTSSLPDDAWHRDVDKIVLAAAAAHPGKIKTAIVGPPTIYGVGRGPGNNRSVQLNLAAKTFLERKEAFCVGRGLNVWHQVHVRDLSRLYLLLGETAVSGGGGGLQATWDDRGYYFAENGAFVWRDVFQAIADEAYRRGLIPSAVVKEKTVEEVVRFEKKYHYRLGGTSRGVAKRAGILLGWKPVEAPLLQFIPELVENEARDLGLL